MVVHSLLSHLNLHIEGNPEIKLKPGAGLTKSELEKGIQNGIRMGGYTFLLNPCTYLITCASIQSAPSMQAQA